MPVCTGSHQDTEGGRIFFGPSQKFQGTPPLRVADGVKEACSYLARDVSEPITAVVRFYQLFVLVHPFYDANGRIGRFITSVYLDYHKHHLFWAKMHRNQKWLRKLNACHTRANEERYMQELVKHWKKFILRKDEIDTVDE